MKKIFFFLLLVPSFGFSQFSDDFSDGNFSANPLWVGDIAKFEINSSKQLHLNATGADTSILYTNNHLVNNNEWQFWVKLSFATSSNNNARVYLISDQQNIAGSLNGYFVQIGEANDSIGLYKQSGTTIKIIIHGKFTYTNNSTNTFRIKVTRDDTGTWKLYSASDGGTVFQLEGSGFDNTFTTTSWFGVFCKYTTSNATKFYFDDFYVGPIIVDTFPPEINSINIISQTQLNVYFSENIDTSTALTITNYNVDNGIGNPVSVEFDVNNGALMHLNFSTVFTEGIFYNLMVNNIKDLNGNFMLSSSTEFILYTPKEHDIVINEIMADPDPIVGLANYEYVELYNRTEYPIKMQNWKFAMGSTIKQIPDATLDPHSYILFSSASGQESISTYGMALAIPSFSITNNGETLTLYDSLYHVISTVSYTDDWYKDANKKDGGWSLEQIDPNNPCGGKDNWKASTGILGGTPGAANSVNELNPDNTIPEFLLVTIIDNFHIQLFFSEPMDSVFLKSISKYFIDNGIGNPANANPVAPQYSSVILELSSEIQNGIIYTITINDTLRDCTGNPLPVSSSKRFAIPQTPTNNDIVINEILSNPKDDGVDYVELYNRSSKVIDLKNFILSSYDTIASSLENIENISDEGYLLFPSEYVVLTSNPAKVKEQYYTPNPNNFISMLSFPTYNNDDGTVVLALKNQSEIIDMVKYSTDMIYPLLNSSEGVSLERINFERPSNDKTNWHSASETVGFGTPAYKNSQSSENIFSDEQITISPEIFSPDNDGYNDILNINYNFDKPGYMANISIYDTNGRLIRNLINNVLLGTSGSFSWDGITDENEKARIGMYIIYFEVFDLNGNVKHYKRSAVLASKL
ncbi:MAG TPA: lamin tail domain-containing protein [Bacteroidales bacterium]|nr:lamin tail domain-containing protein [Bacteroidales bacterium]HPS16608.1 lamin tail domain-containing protein [Bacteroidales bacterium]